MATTDETPVPENYDTGEYELEPQDESTTDDADGDETEEGAWDEDRARKALKKKNAEAKGLRERLRKFEEAEKAKADAEKAEADKNKSSEERFSELSTANQKLQRDYWKMQVALEKGLTTKQAKRLVGDSLEDLQADADELLSDFGSSESTKTTPAPPARRGREVYGSPQGEDKPTPLDHKKIAEEIWNANRGL